MQKKRPKQLGFHNTPRSHCMLDAMDERQLLFAGEAERIEDTKIEVMPIIEDSEFIPEDRSLPARLPSRAVEQQADFTAVNIPGEVGRSVASHLVKTFSSRQGRIDNYNTAVLVV